jgi:predicted nucleotidyltransferase
MRNNSISVLTFMKYLGQLSQNKAVLGVALTGSYGRNSSDEYSDIDYVIFVDKKLNVSEIKEGKFFYDKILFDSRIVEVEYLEKSSWSRDMYFAYLNCDVVYDKSKIISGILDKKRVQWEDCLTKEISLELVKLSVIFSFSDNWRGLKSDSHYFKFLKRKDFISTHRVLNVGFELILDLLYLLNKKPIPDIKNKTRFLSDLAWFPVEIRSFLADSILIFNESAVDCKRRYGIMMKCMGVLKKYIDKNVVLSSDLYEYYLNNR